MRTILRWVLPGFGAALLFPAFAQSLQVRIDNGRLRVSAPQLHFINGQPLDRLRNGAPVAFAIQLMLSRDSDRTYPFERDISRFMVSYDIWAEKFSVTRLGHPRRTASQLSAVAAESWCIDAMTVPAAGLPPDRPLWARLEVRADASNGREQDGEGPVSLARLIDLFSKRVRGEEMRWVADSGPLRLDSLGGTSK